VYECKEGDVGKHCSQAGYEPGEGSAWEVAWSVLGHCDGTITPTSSPSFVTLTDMGGCPNEFSSDENYEEGDKVSKSNLVYECKEGDVGKHCPQAGYEPGQGSAWEVAWSVLGHCDGTSVPTSSPFFVRLADMGGCPSEFSHNEVYEEGDKVSKGNYVYECKDGAVGLHCPQAGYEPGEGSEWETAWTVLGYCDGTIVPTSSPSFVSLADVGVCPDEWSLGSNTKYEEGDMVSVIVSNEPLRKIAYTCKAWPMSDHCGQYSPTDELGGELGWSLAGQCGGSIGPTASPVFVTISEFNGGCPPEYSASTTSYLAGDKVTYTVSTNPVRKLVYECRTWPHSGYCSKAAFAPGSIHDSYGWTFLGSCTGSITPTPAPQPYAGTCIYTKCTMESCTPGDAGCSCDANDADTSSCKVEVCVENTPVDNYSKSVDYDTGDVVRIGDRRYKCREWPNYLWCRMKAYEPQIVDNGVWPEAWEEDGTCLP
ncbi:hypothetical protein ACHAXR_002535, partial [Thalassiosira sp. AJA248-18]